MVSESLIRLLGSSSERVTRESACGQHRPTIRCASQKVFVADSELLVVAGREHRHN
jgi:hypothetical protein